MRTSSVVESFEFAKVDVTSKLETAGTRSRRELTKQISILGPTIMDEPTMEVLCKNCGKTFTAFLKEMADKNAEVTCPSCGENSGDGRLGRPNNVEPPAVQH